MKVERETMIRALNEAADEINEHMEQLRHSKYGEIKYAGLELLSVMAGLAIETAARAIDLELLEATAVITVFAIPNMLTIVALPKSNRLSKIINYETAKYLLAAGSIYADKIYETLALLL